MANINEQKAELRARLKAKAEGISEDYRKEASDRIYISVTAIPYYMISNTVFCFAGVGAEPDTRKLLQDVLNMGKRLCVPYCLDDGVMKAIEIKSLDELKPGRFGIPEPDGSGTVIEPREIDFAIVPCMSCDHEGRRIGHGAGYYDRFLPKVKGMRIAICLEEMVSEPDVIPMGDYDCFLDGVVTDNGPYL